MRLMQDKVVADHEARQREENTLNVPEEEKKARRKNSDYIDVYLDKIADTEDKDSSFYGEQGKRNLQRSLTGMN